jgi:hypothetical protein
MSVFGGQLFDFFPIRDFQHFALPMSSFSQLAALSEEPIEPFDGETRRLFQLVAEKATPDGFAQRYLGAAHEPIRDSRVVGSQKPERLAGS